MKTYLKFISTTAFLILLFIIPTNLLCQELSIHNKDKSRQLDFMIGNWNIEAKIRVSPIAFINGKGTMKIYFDKTRTMFADTKVKFQNFEVNGITKRTFNKKKERWNVSWNPTVPPAVPNIEGQMLNNRFIEVDYGKDNYGKFVGRLVIFNITDDKFSVRKDRLYDDGTLMKETWVYEATRIK